MALFDTIRAGASGAVSFEIARSLTTKIIASTTSSESSKRLCKEVGLYVHGDSAFLLPKKFKY